MSKMKFFLVNMGSYVAGEELSGMRYQPRLADRILEMLSVMSAVVMISLMFYYPQMIFSGIIGILVYALLLICSYAPIRYFRFPFRITRQNVGIQFRLAVTLLRTVSVMIGVITSLGTFSAIYPWAKLAYSIAIIVLFVFFLAYYVLAYYFRR